MTPDPTEPVAVPDPEETEAEEEVFENRAARRAKGKGHHQAPPPGKGQLGTGRGSVQGPRQWGNRRSG